MPNLYGPNDNFDLESSHVLPALIRKFHLSKLAAQRDWQALQRDESLFGPIPEDLKASFGIPAEDVSLNPASTIEDRGSSISNPSYEALTSDRCGSAVPSSVIRPCLGYGESPP